MKITFDERKNTQNFAKHGFTLDVFSEMDFDNAIYKPDIRKDYGEPRWNIYAPVEERLCTASFTLREGVVRVINFRKCNVRERRMYEEETA